MDTGLYVLLDHGSVGGMGGGGGGGQEENRRTVGVGWGGVGTVRSSMERDHRGQFKIKTGTAVWDRGRELGSLG